MSALLFKSTLPIHHINVNVQTYSFVIQLNELCFCAALNCRFWVNCVSMTGGGELVSEYSLNPASFIFFRAGGTSGCAASDRMTATAS